MSTKTRAATSSLAVTATLLAVGACGSTEHPAPADKKPPSPAAAGLPEVPAAAKLPAPSEFVAEVDNPWMPWRPGTEWRFVGHTDAGVENTTITVMPRRKVVLGIAATEVHDVVHLNGTLLEDTYDFYAQDRAGNVWYFGEDTKEYADGKVDTTGSWMAGHDGARAGVAMPADPKPGAAYYQEYYPGEAEDAGQVLSTQANAQVPYGDLHGLVETFDFTRLEPSASEHKYYARGIGVVLEVSLHEKDRTELVSMTHH